MKKHLRNSPLNIWPDAVNMCADWHAKDYCVIVLKDEYLRHTCRVCSLAHDCWPGIHEGSIHSMQSGQSVVREDKKRH